MSTPERSARIDGRVNLELLATQLVVVVGVGTVGSQVARELANAHVGRLLLIDPDVLKEENLPRFAFTNPRYLGRNKAVAMTLYLDEEIRTTRPEALPIAIDDSLSNREVDELLMDADLIVAATGEPAVQRRLGRRALALNIPAIFPSLAEAGDGEVFVQFDRSLPCFFCWQGFRDTDAGVHAVAALNIDALPIIERATHLALGLLDANCAYADLLWPDPGRDQTQLFTYSGGTPSAKSVLRRPNCPSCGGSPPPPLSRPPIPSGPPQSTPAPAPPPEVDFSVLIALAVAVLVVAVIIVGAASGGGNSQSPSPPTATETSKAGTSAEEATTSTATQPPPTTTTPPTTATTETAPPTCGTPAQCVEEGANAAGGESNTTPTEPQHEPTATAASAPQGTSVATALPIEPGVEETGNSGTVAYGEGSCGAEQGQFWKATLNEGEVVTIVWGGPNGSAMGLDIWPPGTGDVHGSGEGRVTYESTEGEHTEETFTAPTTGVYPIVIDDSCGAPGVFHFTLTTRSG